ILNIEDVRKELKQRQNALEKIRQNLIKYRDAQKEGRSLHMDNLIELCDSLYKSTIVEEKDNVQLLTTAIVFAFVHLTILRERHRHYKDIYSNGLNKTYEADLITKVQEYKQYFIDMYDKWEDWRKSLIIFRGLETNPDPDFPCLVNDSFHNLYMYFQYPKTFIHDDKMVEKHRELCVQGQMAFLNEAKDAFMKMYVYTFDLNKFLPGKWAAPPEAPNRRIGTLQYGIVGKSAFPDVKNYGTDYEERFHLSPEQRGIITGLNIHYSDIVHGLTVKYKGLPVTTAGDVKGGEASTIRGLSKDLYITSVEVYFSDRIISGIQFYFNSTPNSDILKSDINVNSSEIFGSDLNAQRFVSEPPHGFKLVGFQMASSKSFSKQIDCLGYTLLTFEHLNIAE
ncbi:3649_t:CDS:2, partial [Racocetra fulgida]